VTFAVVKLLPRTHKNVMGMVFDQLDDGGDGAYALNPFNICVMIDCLMEEKH
jgi:hypothetical protein